MMSKELWKNEDADLSACLPCPFCGGRELSVVDGTTYQWWSIHCSVCDARCGDVSRRGPDANAALVSEWNTRANKGKIEYHVYFTDTVYHSDGESWVDKKHTYRSLAEAEAFVETRSVVDQGKIKFRKIEKIERHGEIPLPEVSEKLIKRYARYRKYLRDFEDKRQKESSIAWHAKQAEIKRLGEEAFRLLNKVEVDDE